MSIEKAIEFAVEAHQGQKRKHKVNGVAIPYVTHPIEVMKKLYAWGAISEKIGTAAVLHDVLEDTDMPETTIFFNFGPDVTNLVKELTLIVPDGISGSEKQSLKAEYMKGFSNKSLEALVIKMADRICNINDFLLTDKDKAKAYKKEAAHLFIAFWERAKVIEDTFGTNVLGAIIGDINAIVEKIGD